MTSPVVFETQKLSPKEPEILSFGSSSNPIKVTTANTVIMEDAKPIPCVEELQLTFCVDSMIIRGSMQCRPSGKDGNRIRQEFYVEQILRSIDPDGLGKLIICIRRI
jgi:hypothetical protein